MFTLNLAGALYHLRAVTARLTPPLKYDNGMPEETKYSDDVDFLDTDKSILDKLLPIATKVFEEWDLQINNSKTEFVSFQLAQKDEGWCNSSTRK